MPLIAETHQSKGRQYPYLRDVAHRRGFDCAAHGRSVRAEPLEEAIGEIIRQLVLPANWREGVMELLNADSEHLRLQRRWNRLQEKLGRLRTAFLDIELDEAAYRREQATLQAELAAIAVPDTKKVEEAAAFLQTLAVAWDEATPAERRELLHLLLDTIRVDVLGKRIVAIKPKPAFAPLFQQITGLTEDNGWFQELGG